MRISSRITLWSCCLLLATVARSAAEDWPEWRGPAGQGHASATSLPLVWSETENVVWKTSVPGRGWSTPVILGDKIWLTTAEVEEISAEEKDRRLATITNQQPLQIVGGLKLWAIGIDRQTGAVRHRVLLLELDDPDPTHVENSFASPTPLVEPGRLYCHFGTYGTACVDTNNAEVVWTNQQIHVQHENGPGSSPILWRDLLLFHCDGTDTQFVTALDKRSGKQVWQTERSGELREDPQLRKAYATPLVVQVEGQSLLLSPGADWVYGYEPATGQERWKLSYGALGFSNSARPVAGEEHFYLCTGYMKSRVLAVRYIEDGRACQPQIAWSYDKQVSEVPSPLLVNDRLYFVSDKGGVVTCLNADDGEVVWRDRLSGNYRASPLYADGRIFFLARDGTMSVIASGDRFQLLAKNRLDGHCMASPIAAGGSLYIRTDGALYRIGG